MWLLFLVHPVASIQASQRQNNASQKSCFAPSIHLHVFKCRYLTCPRESSKRSVLIPCNVIYCSLYSRFRDDAWVIVLFFCWLVKQGAVDLVERGLAYCLSLYFTRRLFLAGRFSFGSQMPAPFSSFSSCSSSMLVVDFIQSSSDVVSSCTACCWNQDTIVHDRYLPS